MAGEGGFEPPLTEPESAVLPLDDSPIVRIRINYLIPPVKVKLYFTLYGVVPFQTKPRR